MNNFEKVILGVAISGIAVYVFSFFVLKIMIDSIKKADENER